jgi:hypothetical protein
MLDKPKSERQCRPIALLLKLGSEYVSEVWTKVVGLKDTKITAKLVEEVRHCDSTNSVFSGRRNGAHGQQTKTRIAGSYRTLPVG